jgi:excisionase family DNA binding protein
MTATVETFASKNQEEDANLWIESKEICDLLAVSDKVLGNMVKRGTFPKHKEMGTRKRRWDRAEVMTWIERMRSQPDREMTEGVPERGASSAVEEDEPPPPKRGAGRPRRKPNVVK